eukprot:SAG11_NODE_7160_length_1185_cov_1.073665_1_plen_222_part_00
MLTKIVFLSCAWWFCMCFPRACRSRPQISALAATGGGALLLAHLALPQAAFYTALGGLSDAGSRLALQAVMVSGYPELGALTGTITAGVEGEPFTYDPPTLIDSMPPFFSVRSGPCTTAVVGGRQCVGRWPGGYLPNEDCEIVVGGGGGTLGACLVFDIHGSDVALPDGSHHYYSDCSAGAGLTPGQAIRWHSDGYDQGENGNGLPNNEFGAGGGWQLCFA